MHCRIPPRQHPLRNIDIALRRLYAYEKWAMEQRRIESLSEFPTDKLLLKYQRLAEQLD